VSRLHLTACFLAVTLVASPLRAASVVLVQPANPAPGMTEALARIHGELVSAGFDMEVVDSSSIEGAHGESRAWLERLAAERGSDAVVAMLGNGGPNSVEVWVIDKVTGKLVMRRVAFQPASPRGSETLAIQAIELLRASFLEIELSSRSRPNQPKPAPSPTVVEFVETERRASRPERVGMEVGATLSMSIDGMGPALLPIVRFDWAPRPWLLVQATAAGLGTRSNVRGNAGNAVVAQEFALLGASYRFGLGKRLQPFVSFSGGLLHMAVDGKADSPYAGVRADHWAFLLDGGFGVRMRLPDRFQLSLAAHAQLAEPYPAIRFAGQVVATSGRPSILLTLTIGAWL
jgi:hypothetical protein